MDVPTARWLTEWSDQQKKRLIDAPLVGYASGGSAMAEPVAFAAITACAFQLKQPAEVACKCLLDAQNKNGSVSVHLDDQGPFWPTSLAAIAWRQFERTWPPLESSSLDSPSEGSSPKGSPPKGSPPLALQCRDAYRNAIDFLTSFGGEKIGENDIFGHNTDLVGWPWVSGTHSWIEPTAMALLAMRQCGFAKHPRATEAAELLLDRQLPSGGANYGNTFVLGQKLRPHVMPSAMCMVALHRFKPKPRSQKAAINYLRSEINRPIAGISVAWAIHGLASNATELSAESEVDFLTPLKAAIGRRRGSGENPHRQNLLMLASRVTKSPLLDLAYHSLPEQRATTR